MHQSSLRLGSNIPLSPPTLTRALPEAMPAVNALSWIAPPSSILSALSLNTLVPSAEIIIALSVPTVASTTADAQRTNYPVVQPNHNCEDGKPNWDERRWELWFFI
ncbi:hypothetical protein A0H81_04783 [Grifola frondosa]|uniref:Uncharacterized protein n=1 Tax=Grifola frondosa TaxID=5627 RepID=A0A1C7MEN2_GRIFR|nr:hypothetical protein A0H81_04783 [Grifola frondosa]